MITAIAASLLGARLADRFGIKRVYLAGLVAGLLSMSLLIVSQFFTSDQSVAYAYAPGATACLGVGFGLTVPALNIFAAAFHPAGVDRADPRPERSPRARHRPGAGLRRDLRRARLLVGDAA